MNRDKFYEGKRIYFENGVFFKQGDEGKLF